MISWCVRTARFGRRRLYTRLTSRPEESHAVVDHDNFVEATEATTNPHIASEATQTPLNSS